MTSLPRRPGCASGPSTSPVEVEEGRAHCTVCAQVIAPAALYVADEHGVMHLRCSRAASRLDGWGMTPDRPARTGTAGEANSGAYGSPSSDRTPRQNPQTRPPRRTDRRVNSTDTSTYLLGLPPSVQADLADLARTSQAMTEAQKHEALEVITVMAETFAAARNETQMGVLKLLAHAGAVVGSTHQHQTTEGA